jgi:hypothetical protein
MLIYEFQGVVCVDGLVLNCTEFHFGNDPKIQLGDEAKSVTSKREPSLYEPQKKLGTSQVSIVPGGTPVPRGRSAAGPRF